MPTRSKKPRSADLEAAEGLRRLRAAAGIPLEDIAEQVGVSGEQVSKYLKGKNRMSVGTYMELWTILTRHRTGLVSRPAIAGFGEVSQTEYVPPQNSELVDKIRSIAAGLQVALTEVHDLLEKMR